MKSLVDFPCLRAVLVAAAGAALVACGGGGSSDSGPSTPPTAGPGPEVSEVFLLQREQYVSGDLISLDAVGEAPSKVKLLFASGAAFELPLVGGKNYVLAPVLPANLRGQPCRVVVTTASAVKQSNAIKVEALSTEGATPGLASLLYLDATIDRAQQGLSEYQAFIGEETAPEMEALGKLLDALKVTRSAVEAAMAGRSTPLARTSSGEILVVDPAQLDVLDQSFMVLRKVAASSPELLSLASASEKAARTERPSAVECSTLLSASDRAFCRNSQAAAASDYLINYAGAVGVAGTALGIAAVVVGLPTIGGSLATLSVGGVVLANLYGGLMQVASASGTGSREGLNTIDNVQNLGQVAADMVAGQLARLLPHGDSNYVRTLNDIVVGETVNGVIDKIDRRVHTAGGASRQNPSGSQEAAQRRISGTWAGTFLGGSATSGSCPPDLFPPSGSPLPDEQFVQTSTSLFEWRTWPDRVLTMRREPHDPLLFTGTASSAEGFIQVNMRFSSGYQKASNYVAVSGSGAYCSFTYGAQYVKR